MSSRLIRSGLDEMLGLGLDERWPRRRLIIIRRRLRIVPLLLVLLVKPSIFITLRLVV